MTLRDYLNHHYIPDRPGLTADYRRRLDAVVRSFVVWTGRRLSIQEVDRPLLAAWASAMLAAGNAPITVNTKLRQIRTLLLAAYDDGILDRPPRRNRRLRETPPTPEAWTVDECRRLIAHLAALPGRVGDVPAGRWWVSLCLAVYWTGCRIGALRAAVAADYSPGVGLLIRRQKNGRQQFYRLPESCCEAVNAVLPECGLIWRWPLHPRMLWTHFRRYVEAVGLPAPRTHCQLFHRLRRTTASYCALVDPAIAQRQLDHSHLRTTIRHYVDPRIAVMPGAASVLPDVWSREDSRLVLDGTI